MSLAAAHAEHGFENFTEDFAHPYQQTNRTKQTT